MTSNHLRRGLVDRRQFVTGALAVGAAAGIGLRPGQAWARNGHPELVGKLFDLTLGDAPVNVTGRRVTGTLINDLLPGPILRWREGDTVTLNVTNRLADPSSIHWHGIRLPADMDGVPGLSFPGIAPGETFTYRFPVHQSGTYWYHSHSGFQEQTGLAGPLIIEPRGGYAQRFDRDYVIMLQDWSDASPEEIVSNLKFQSNYYNWHQRTVGTFFADVARKGLGPTIDDRLAWGGMRMDPTDISDVTGTAYSSSAYTFLLNGQPPGANWTGLFRPGERVRLRFINGSAMTFFDVRIPGLTMHVVEADGNGVEPVPVDEFRIGVAETYDVIVEPKGQAYTIFAQSESRTGYARGTLATQPGMAAPVPLMDPRPLRTMVDMGMGKMDMTGASGSGGHGGMDMGNEKANESAMPGMQMGAGAGHSGSSLAKVDAKLAGRVSVDNVAMDPINRLNDPGDGLEHNGRRVLTYAMLRATRRGADPRPPSREITLHLTGNMQRYMWGFDGKKFSNAGPIRLAYGERVRFTLINDTMMEHPIHLHGLWSELENGQGAWRPYKHTVVVQAGEKLSYLVTADERGAWAYHCHLLYHMEMGMFRVVEVV